MSNRVDLRPGLRLEHTRNMENNQLYHFQAFGVLWTAKLERKNNKQDGKTKTATSNDTEHVSWAAIEMLEGNQGMSNGTLKQFEAWFKLHGQLSPLEPSERWRKRGKFTNRRLKDDHD